MPRRKKQPPPAAPVALPPLDAVHDRESAARVLGGPISLKTFDRLVKQLRLPPDFYVGRSPRWVESRLRRARTMLERHHGPWSIRPENVGEPPPALPPL